MLEFYELREGVVLLSGAGQWMAKMPDDSQDFGSVWDQYSDGAARPPALDAALDAPPSELPDRPSDAGAEGGNPGELGAAQPIEKTVGGYCDTQYFTVGDPPPGACPQNDWVECLDNWWNGRHIWANNAWWFYGNSCARLGNHVLEIVSGGGGGNWTVNEDTARWYRMGPDVYGNFDVTMDITNASGDSFNHRFRVNLD